MENRILDFLLGSNSKILSTYSKATLLPTMLIFLFLKSNWHKRKFLLIIFCYSNSCHLFIGICSFLKCIPESTKLKNTKYNRHDIYIEQAKLKIILSPFTSFPIPPFSLRKETQRQQQWYKETKISPGEKG